MPSSFENLLHRLGLRRRSQDSGYPSTYLLATQDSSIERPAIFDPALAHFPRGFRAGDPIFTDAATAERWLLARRRVMDQLLRAVAQSQWKDHLVLRGSLLMKLWFGDEAREPGDMDWLVQPTILAVGEDRSKQLLRDMAAIGSTCQKPDDIPIEATAIDEIWNYDRAPGRRIVFRWKLPDLPSGTVQMDFVYNEKLHQPAVLTPLSKSNAPALQISTASKEISLAWKILWLESDIHPQGKDLYDAVLLAEQVELSRELLEKVLGADYCTRHIHQNVPFEWHVEWQHFQQEYPHLNGDLEHWQTRLSIALASLFKPG